MRRSDQVSTIRHREPLDRRQSALVSAGMILNKRVTNRIRNRLLSGDNYIVMYIVAGGGTYEDPQNGVRQVRAGDVIITFPGLPHSYHPEHTWDEFFVCVRGPLFRQLEEEGMLQRDTPVISSGLAPALTSAFKSLVEDFMSNRPLTGPVQTARVHMILAQLVEAHHSACSARRSDDFLERACALLEADLEREIDVRQVARKFNFGYERFRKLFAEQSGLSPARYRILRRIDGAKALLMEGDMPIKTIAEKLGYCDVYFFTRQFKQVTGITPSAFRRVKA